MTTFSNKRPIEGNKAEPTKKRIKDAISNGDTLLVQKLLDDGADFDAQINVTKDGYVLEYESGLIWAARNNQREIAELIISHKEDHQDGYPSVVSQLLELYFEEKEKNINLQKTLDFLEIGEDSR